MMTSLPGQSTNTANKNAIWHVMPIKHLALRFCAKDRPRPILPVRITIQIILQSRTCLQQLETR